ncbi:hypothetical protein [Subtercola endophyticus]|uniref:hypothetical protein n=1 Tax=Subtercola endophyticus TaxID=2895559 RepID=UPI001E495C90|nr:hypothetical protein [Subtercola endophyticus]UFS60113.1 hypothetical protein LQ955_04920 [Subtercola endophyticus]
MSDTTTPAPDDSDLDDSDLDDSDLDKIEEDEDKREEAQFNKSIEADGLLPVPDAAPTDGPAPAA